MSRNSNQLSVAELLARNGAQPASGGGRRRRGGRGLSVDDLSGDLPVVERNGSAHAAPDEADEEYPASEAGDPGATGFGARDHGSEPVSYAAPDPNNSPMSGPITVYNPLEPYPPGPGDAPTRLGDPDPYASGREQFPPAEEAPRRGGRRRRVEPDDDFAAFADDPGAGAQPWETGPPTPGGGRAARRRAAEAAEAAAAAEAAPAEPEAPPAYGLPPGPGDFGRPSGPDFGGPDAGPPWPGQGFDGPPRLGPPGAAPPTEAWQAPEPAADDPRPKLERRRRGARPLPEPASFPDPSDQPNADQTTAVWSPADQGMRLRAGLQGLETPPHDAPDFGGPGVRRTAGPMPPPPAPDFGADQGFGPGQHFGADQGFAPDPGYAPDPDYSPDPRFGPDPGFAKTDIFATDVHGPMRPHSGPDTSGERYETGEFEPEFDADADEYDDPEDAAGGENRLGRARSALSGRFGAAGDKFAATKARFGSGARTTDRETAEDPRKQWIVLGAQSVGAAIAGMLAFKGFEMLWEGQPLAALALAVVVILGLVALVRILRRGDDMFSTVIAVVVGVFVTLGPLAFLLSTG
ncbi:hypothetical protein [Nocardia testacea]|uniref:hypothetical protein n=1 Tax=Nocardia testacea TaxID=248551 RepID=UPI003A8C70A7